MEITAKIMIIMAIRFPPNALTGHIISNLSIQIISNSFSLFSQEYKSTFDRSTGGQEIFRQGDRSTNIGGSAFGDSQVVA